MAADVSKYLERAKRYWEKNKLQDAIEAFQAVLEIHPDHLEALQALGDIHARLNQPDRAAFYYGLVFDRMTEPADEPRAMALYARYLRGLPQQPERMARFALLLQKQNKPEEAIEQYAAAGDLYLTQGRQEEALACRDRIAQLDPGNAERQFALAELAEKLGKAAVAARGFLRAGQISLAEGQLDRAVELLRHAYRLAPDERSVALLYAQACLRRNDAPTAVKLLEPFAAGENDPEFLKTLGEASMRSGQLDRARSALEKFYQEKPDSFDKLFELASRYLQAGQDDHAVRVLRQVQQRMVASHREHEFAAHLDPVAEAHPSSVRLMEFWASVYNELNREAKYFDVLVRLFDAYLQAGDLAGACQALDKLVDVDPYDYRNLQRLERLEGKADPAYLRRVSARLARSASPDSSSMVQRDLREQNASVPPEEGSAQRTLEDLLVQAEIFLQYSLQAQAVERLQKIVEMFPEEVDQNDRLRQLFEQAKWWPPGVKRAAPAPMESAAPASRTGAYAAETLRDLTKISEINHSLFRQSSPRAVLSVAVNEVGKYLRATRCLAVVGVPGQQPQFAAEFCAPGVEASPGAQIVRLLAQFERAPADSLGGRELDTAAAPVLREMGLDCALGVQITDKDTKAAAGMLLAGYPEPHRWKPNETFFLQAVGDQMLLTVSHTRQRAMTRTVGVADEKTGLLGRSSYQECLLSEAQRAKTQGTPLALAILQIDRGPELLRQQGEAQLDHHIERVARAVQPVVRQNDLAVRYSAWALAFILPDTALTGARKLAEKLRKVAAGVRPPWDGAPVTLSAAVVEAAARPEYDTEDIVTEVINRAEASLEEARRQGGDTIAASETPRS